MLKLILFEKGEVLNYEKNEINSFKVILKDIKSKFLLIGPPYKLYDSQVR